MFNETNASRRGCGVLVLGLCLLGAVFSPSGSMAQSLPRAEPESVGMSTERLARINAVIQQHIDAGTITGAVTAVARRGQVVHLEAHGYANPGAGTLMPRDAIFRMASSTKPVTGVALLMMLEEGKVRLNDPVHRFIPEFADLKVAVPKDGRSVESMDDVELVAAERPITVLDLLTHTSGVLSGGPGSALSDVPPPRNPEDTLENYLPRLAAVPLDFQPGSRWAYSGLAGIDMLARIVEVTSGEDFDSFLRTRIFEPLGMSDTHLNLPEQKHARLLPLYRRNGDEWERVPTPWLLETRQYHSGAGGLMSTAEDFLRFEMMLANGGELNGQRLLGPRTVELMGSNFVGDLYKGLFGNSQGMGYGLSVQVVLDPIAANSGRAKGSFNWGGAFGTITWTDPAEEIAAVIMVQQFAPQVAFDFEWAIRQAIID
jgi:CubicO group peptidase (beta-lactamase class C family)